MCHWQLHVLLGLLRLGKEGIKKESSERRTIIRTEENLYRLILNHQIKKENTLKVNLNIKSLVCVTCLKWDTSNLFEKLTRHSYFSASTLFNHKLGLANQHAGRNRVF